ncbi:hypothetical protein NDU88_000827 [Pleurodeles waltl]|uniref:Uncharacterized protein n=1 Tax=Pleurodeles waltl TaxID=8319 RepID=A0AAV7USG1_PLEWA|nr:hypothetical protein NDU88_000827 [Pleurodeles waltl]
MLLKARAFRCQGEKTRHYGYAYSSSCASRFQGEETCFPLPGREDKSLWLRVQFLAHHAHRKLSEEPL